MFLRREDIQHDRRSGPRLHYDVDGIQILPLEHPAVVGVAGLGPDAVLVADLRKATLVQIGDRDEYGSVAEVAEGGIVDAACMPAATDDGNSWGSPRTLSGHQ